MVRRCQIAGAYHSTYLEERYYSASNKSARIVKTIGIVVVAALARRADSVFATITATDETSFLQTLAKRRHRVGVGGRGAAVDKADYRYGRWLLRSQRERPSDCRSAEQRREFSSSHCLPSRLRTNVRLNSPSDQEIAARETGFGVKPYCEPVEVPGQALRFCAFQWRSRLPISAGLKWQNACSRA